MEDRRHTVLITGASGNVGRAAVEKFLSKGYQVIATVSPGKNHSFDSHDRLEVVETDLANRDMTTHSVDQILRKHSIIDAALLLAGGYEGGGVGDTNTAQLEKMISLNFKTAFHIVQPVFSKMKTQPEGGRIVLIGARSALRPQDGKNSFAYSLSKSMLFKMAEFLNAEGSSVGVSTSVIVPATIDTPQNREAMPSADFNSWVKPEDIAEMMVMICSEKDSSLRDPVIKMYGNS
jgi:NAD(P)-dependent dehydrogenase (short-subunit alcohol dehydrogenase family)